jgi:muconate cycloisomerase
MHEQGFRSFLLKIGMDPNEDYENVKALRERLGPDVKIRIDANGSMSFDTALALFKRLEPLAIESAEQPLPPWDLEGMAALAARVNMPIMADESCGDAHDLINSVRMRAASVIQTKQSKNGGIWNVRKIWTVADAAGIRIYPGNHACTSVNTAAVAHLATAWSGDTLVDGPFAMGVSGELEFDVVVAPLETNNGRLRVSDAPGLGITLDEDSVARMRAPNY